MRQKKIVKEIKIKIKQLANNNNKSTKHKKKRNSHVIKLGQKEKKII